MAAHFCDIVSAMFEIDFWSSIFILYILLLFHSRCFTTIISTCSFVFKFHNPVSFGKNHFWDLDSRIKRLASSDPCWTSMPCQLLIYMILCYWVVNRHLLPNASYFLGIYQFNGHPTILLCILLQALIRKWAPVAIVLGVVIFLFWVKNKIWWFCIMRHLSSRHPRKELQIFLVLLWWSIVLVNVLSYLLIL